MRPGSNCEAIVRWPCSEQKDQFRCVGSVFGCREHDRGHSGEISTQAWQTVRRTMIARDSSSMAMKSRSSSESSSALRSQSGITSSWGCMP